METITVNTKKPLDYLKLVFHRKWLIIIPTVIGIIGGIIAGNVLPKKYESSTIILVEEGRASNPLIKGLAVTTSVNQRLNILREQILGWDRLNQLIKQLDLARDVHDQKGYEDLIKRLRKNIKVTKKGNNIVSISYYGTDAQQAMKIVKTITDIFIAENLKQQTSETNNAISFINDQLKLYQKKLKQSEISSMEEKLSGLLVDSTDKHPMVRDLREKINKAKADMERGNYQVDMEGEISSDAEVKGLKEELTSLKRELATSTLDSEASGENRAKLANKTNDKLYKLLLMERVEKVTAQDVNVNKKLYDELLQRLETAKITQQLEASKDGTRYTILDPARLPLKPAKPDKIMVLLMGMAAGMCLGFGLVLIVEMLDGSFLGADEAGAYFDLPILGMIPKIITESDVREQKIHKIKVTSISVLTTTVLLVVIIYNVLIKG